MADRKIKITVSKEVDGFHWTDDSDDLLDERKRRAYETKAQATVAAIESAEVRHLEIDYMTGPAVAAHIARKAGVEVRQEENAV